MKHILLIEDDKNLLNMIRLLIQRNTCCKVVTAETGLDAKVLLSSKIWDLVITDINLPDCSGLELVGWIRAHNDFAKILMITGNDDSSVAIKALNLNVDAYLLKPFDINEFIETVNKLTSLNQNNFDYKKDVVISSHEDDGIGFKTPDDHPFELLRQCAVDDLKILDSEPNTRFDRFTKLAASIFNVPISTISLIDKNRQWFLSKQGLDVCETSRGYSFCGHAILEEDIFVIEDASKHPDFKNNPLVIKSPYIRFYAGAVIRDNMGLPLGTLCLISNVKKSFPQSSRDQLIDLSKLLREEIIPSCNSMLDRTKYQLQAQIDPITKGFCKNSFVEINDRYIKENIYSSQAYLILIDITNLTSINNFLGRINGDETLVKISNIIHEKISDLQKITIGRTGNNQLCTIIDSDAFGLNENEIVEKVCQLFNFQISSNFGQITPVLKIGMSWLNDENSVVNLIDQCEFAISYLKVLNTSKYATFLDKTSSSRYLRYCQVAVELQEAIDQSKLHLVFQPQVDVKEHCLTGLECLLRWSHGTLGPISPVDIFKVARRINLVTTLDRWVISTVISQISIWNNNGSKYVNVAVNINAETLLEEGFIGWISSQLTKHKVASGQFSLELLENSIFDDFTRVREVIHQIKKLGVNFSLDDFGTGYSSFAYLQSLDVDYIKIDKSLISNLDDKNPKNSMVSYIIKMAKDIGISVIAEGVETQQQLSILENIQCNQVQGYLTGRPQTIEQIDQWIKQSEYPWNNTISNKNHEQLENRLLH